MYLNHTHAHILMRACPCTEEDADAAADKSGYDPTNEKRGKMPRFGFGTDGYAVELSYINPKFD